MKRFVATLAISAAVIAGGVVTLRLYLRTPPNPPRDVSVAPLPEEFIWGVASSAYQSEGGRIDSNQQRIADLQVRAGKPGIDPYGNSVDFRHRYREDIGLARDLGVNSVRISINWARVEPAKGRIDDIELAYYDDLILAFEQAGIEPMICLDHFVYPGWIWDQGGWANPQTVDDFVAYAHRITSRYHDKVHWWLTFNEASIYVMGDAAGGPVGWRSLGDVRRNIADAHRRTYQSIHALDAKAHVSSNIVWAGDTTSSQVLQFVTDQLFLNLAIDFMDFIGVDYYTPSVTDELRADSHPWNWKQDPAGLYRALKALSQRYPNKPLLVTENGMATEDTKPRADGVEREDSLRDSVYWVQGARDDGINVIGYMVWSLTDNFEWGSYGPRFGLYSIDAIRDPELIRKATPAVPIYQKIIRERGVAADYRPVIN